MANRVFFSRPPYVSPVQYEVSFAPTATAVWNVYGFIPNEIPGPNWDASTERFFFDDAAGTDTSVYRVKALGPVNEVLADSGPFQPDVAVTALLSTRAKVDHNYGGIDALQFVTPSGAAIPDAEIRIFKQPDFVAGLRDVPLFIVQTRADGRWVRPVYLEAGMNYVLLFDKAAAYSSDPVTITV